MDFKTLERDIENCKRITNMYNDLLQQLFDAIQDDLKREEKEYNKKAFADEVIKNFYRDKAFLKDIDSLNSLKKEEVKLP